MSEFADRLQRDLIEINAQLAAQHASLQALIRIVLRGLPDADRASTMRTIGEALDAAAVYVTFPELPPELSARVAERYRQRLQEIWGVGSEGSP